MSNMVASLSLLAMIDILTAFLPLVGEEAGVAPSVVGVLLGVRGLASIASRLLLPLLSGRFSRRALLIASLLASGLALIVPAVPGQLLVGRPLPRRGRILPGTGPAPDHDPDLHGRPGHVARLGARGAAHGQPARTGDPPRGPCGAVAAPFGPGGAIWLTCALLIASGAEKAVRRPREG